MTISNIQDIVTTKYILKRWDVNLLKRKPTFPSVDISRDTFEKPNFYGCLFIWHFEISQKQIKTCNIFPSAVKQERFLVDNQFKSRISNRLKGAFHTIDNNKDQ